MSNLCKGQARAEIFELLQKNSQRLLHMCLLWTGGSPQEAEDALSRAKILALERFSQDAPPENCEAWLLTLAHNVCMDLHRERKRRCEVSLEEIVDDFEVERAYPHRPESNPELQYLANETKAILLTQIRGLPERLRLPLLLKAFSGETTREIADRLGLTEVGVRKRIQESRAALRGQFATVSEPKPSLVVEHLDEEFARSVAGVPPSSGKDLRILALRQVSPRNDGSREVTLVLRYPPQRAAANRLFALASYIEKHPRGWKKKLHFARLLAEAGRFDEAITQYRVLAAQQGRVAPIWLELTALLTHAGHRAEAVETCARAQKHFRGFALRHHFAGQAAYVSRSWPEAIERFKMAVQDDEKAAAHWTALGQAYLEAGRPGDAWKAFEAALDLDPQDPLATIGGHDALCEAGRKSRAFELIRRAAKLDSTNVPVALRLARGLLSSQRAGSPSQELELLRGLKRSAHQSAQANVGLALLSLARGQNSAALQIGDQLVLRFPFSAIAHVGRAEVSFRAGDDRPFVESAVTACELDPENRQTSIEAAKLLLSTGHAADLDALAQNFQSRFPDDWTVISEIAKVRSSYAPETALELSRQCCTLQPDLPLTWLRHGTVLSRLGESGEALSSFEKGFDMLPAGEVIVEAIDAACTLLGCLSKSGSAEASHLVCGRALDLARQLEPIHPASASFYEAKVFDGLGKTDLALRRYREALAIGLGSPERQQAQKALALLTQEIHEGPPQCV